MGLKLINARSGLVVVELEQVWGGRQERADRLQLWRTRSPDETLATS
ncbi:MAG: hypothetical protein AB4050_11585 [Synechococcus sp.]